MSWTGGPSEDPWRATGGHTREHRGQVTTAGRLPHRLPLPLPLLWFVRSWRRPPARTPLWMPIAAAILAALLVGTTTLMVAWALAWAHRLDGLQPTAPDVQILPAPVGGHPFGDAPWFLVVGDSIGAGITPETLGRGPNSSWVAGLTQRLAASRHAWRPDDLACPTESTLTYATGCRLAFTNPLLEGRRSGRCPSPTSRRTARPSASSPSSWAPTTS